MFLEQLLNGIQMGLTYLLIALGYNLMFGVLKIVNLAYGEVFMVGSFSALFFYSHVCQIPALVILAGVAGAALAGVFVHLAAVRPLGDVATLDSPRHLAVLVSTIGASLILQNAAVQAFGGYPQRFPRLIPDFALNVLNMRIDFLLPVNLTVSALLVVVLFVLLERTSLGLRIRALSDDFQLAQCIGISTTKDQMVAVLLSSCLAGLAAVLVSQSIGATSPFMGAYYGFKGLVVVIVGGLGRMRGAVWVAMLLGIGESFATHLSSNYRDAITFAVLVAFIVAKGASQELKNEAGGL